MAEIYWLTRLAGVETLALFLLVFSVVVAIVAAVWYFSTSEDYMEEERDVLMKLVKKWKSTWVCSLLFGILGTVFIPTQREILLIYGLGSTIDYIKSNDKAKELPDKAVDALTKYLETLNEEKKK
jgi:hypothetical protein